MEQLHNAMDFFMRHQTILGYSIVSLLTAASEQIFSSVVFKCPCDSGNMLYGLTFLLVPAFILFLLGYMVSASTWRLLTGSCPPENHCSCSPCGTCTRNCFVLVVVTARAFVAPLTWIAVALLRSDFYECFFSGSSLIKYFVCKGKGQECHKLLVKIPCDEELSKNMTAEYRSLQAESQVIGWLLIASVMTLALILTCISRCKSPFSYLQFKFSTIYLKKEEELFEIKAKEHATRLAEINMNSIFETADPVSFQTPSNEDWQKISSLYTFNSKEQYYSMIHKYVNTNRGKNIRFGKEGQNPTALESVDEESPSETGF